MFQNQHSDTGKAEPISGFGQHGWMSIIRTGPLMEGAG